MLGTIVRVHVDRPLNSRNVKSGELYTANWGFISDGEDEEPSTQEACVVGVGQSISRFRGKIVASISGLRKGEVYVVAPTGRIVYEPEIREALRAEFDSRKITLYCLYEKSCGAVIFQGTEQKRQFLLIKNLYGKHWGFPKGHMEKGESERETAAREVLEETGLAIEILDGFRETSGYHPRPKISKRVVFFLGRACSGEVIIQQEEIERFRWVSYSGAMEILRFENDRRVLTRAWEWLKKNPYL